MDSDRQREAPEAASVAQRPADPAERGPRGPAHALTGLHARLLFETAAEGIVLQRADGAIVDCNARAEVVLGLTRDQMLGRDSIDPRWSSIREDGSDYPGSEHPAMIALATGRPQLGRIMGVRTPDSELRWILVNSTPYTEPDSGEPAVMSTFSDITRMYEADELLRARAVQLEKSNAELQDFAYVASHDLQEPLRKIRAFGDRLVKRETGLSERGREYLERMQAAAARMSTMIDDLLTFSRVRSERRASEAVDLEALVDGMIADLPERIHVERDPLPTVPGDPAQLRRLFMNLLGNAAKFRHPEREPRVRISWTRIERASGVPCARIEVRDNGIGFDAAHAERIFVMFQRLHPRQSYDGTGIGLALCRKIVDHHDGDIRATGRPGEGATFIVDLPLVRIAPAVVEGAA